MRNYSSRREQLRLLAMFVPLALVILVMGRLRDPETARAVNTFFTDAEQNDATTKPRQPVARQASLSPSQPIPGIRADLLKTIQDNTYFRTGEKDAWFHFLALIQKVEDHTTPAIPVEYAQLVDQPKVYRGKLVTVRGTARRITREEPAENALGISTYYRVVVQPADAANWPIIVYCLELPQGISPGDELSLDVMVRGLFFKKLSYKWQNGLGIAPVIVAKSFVASNRADKTTSVHETPAAELIDSDNDRDTVLAVENSQNGREAFERILSLAGWDADRLAEFEDGESLSETQRVEALELLRRLRSIDTAVLDAWTTSGRLTKELENLDAVRGQLYRLSGLVTKVTKRTPAPDDANRLEMPAYFECQFEAAELEVPVTIITSRVPQDWLHMDSVRRVAAASALFIKRITDETPSRTVWLAKEIAWHPRLPGSAPATSNERLIRGTRDPLLGKSVLGTLAIDVGRYDLVESRGRIRPQERDLFYETMSAIGIVEPSTLVRIAKENLPIVEQEWNRELHNGESAQRKALALEVVRRADQGRYSIAMLFNDPEPQIGRLLMFDGVARRAVRVEVGGASDEGNSSDIAERYGFDHYYELEVFTDDSQNYPLVFLARELPKGFPVGTGIRVPVRVAGFFFKNWLYSARGGPQADSTGGKESARPRAQFAPLLIGRAPIVLATEQSRSGVGRFVLGGLFILALVGIWAAAAWFARDDRRFRERTPAANFTLPPGQSLDDLNLRAADMPMTTHIEPSPGDSTN